jgi:hypothetical protein
MRPIACATSSAGATTSISSYTFTPRRRARQIPTAAPPAIPPQIPRPPSQIANGPHQCWGICENVVTMK